MSIRQYALSMKKAICQTVFHYAVWKYDTFFGALFPLRGNRLLEKMLDLHGTVCSRANMPFQPVPAAMG